MVSGRGFEVPRRVYVDFEGINLRRKFLTGLEPESINMTIGKNIWEALDCGMQVMCLHEEMKYLLYIRLNLVC